MKTRLRGHGPFGPLSLVFVLKLIPAFIDQNNKFFYHACIKEGCSANLRIASEKKS
jgi:hypothetical protein